MTIFELGALGEFVGAMLLFGSLVFVGFQVRQNTKATRAVSHHTITDALNQLNLTFAKDPAVAKLWTSGMNDRSSLDGVQLDQYDALMRAYMHICDTMYYQAQVGAGDHGLWKAEERYLGVILNSNGGTAWLEENILSISPGFREALDDIIPRYRSSDAEEADPLSVRYQIPGADT